MGPRAGNSRGVAGGPRWGSRGSWPGAGGGASWADLLRAASPWRGVGRGGGGADRPGLGGRADPGGGLGLREDERSSGAEGAAGEAAGGRGLGGHSGGAETGGERGGCELPK